MSRVNFFQSRVTQNSFTVLHDKDDDLRHKDEPSEKTGGGDFSLKKYTGRETCLQKILHASLALKIFVQRGKEPPGG